MNRSPRAEPLRQVRRVGERALLVQCADLAEVIALHDKLRREPLPGQADLLSAARTVLVVAHNPETATTLHHALANIPVAPTKVLSGEPVTINVVYDGADLTEVAAQVGMSVEAVIAAHTGQVWTSAFNGFAPGFAYCVGENHVLNVTRRPTPRTLVPADSVGLAAEFSAVYPKASPGGWQLIGHTDTAMWDLTRDEPALINPGDRVRYVAVRELVTLSPVADETPKQDDVAPPCLEVRSPGWLSLIQDGGRPGKLDKGISVSGAADTAAMRRGNAALGNQPTAAVIETLGGLELVAHGNLRVAAVPPGEAAKVLTLSDGDTIQVPFPERGMRSYVAVDGGFAPAPVLGSRSTDLLSGLGPQRLAPGMFLPVGAASPMSEDVSDDADSTPLPIPTEGVDEPSSLLPADSADATVIRVILGPREDWLTQDAVESLLTQTWTVSGDSNRVGIRLIGDPLERSVTDELPSEGTQPGAVQIPPSGMPVVFLRDHPVTGGYPVVAVALEADLDTLAQLRPGATLQFTLA